MGIGLNVTLTKEEAPDPVATSLGLLGSSTLDRNQLIYRMLGELASRIDAWRGSKGPDARLVADYERFSLTFGPQSDCQLAGNRRVKGTARVVDELGRLGIDTGHELVTVSAGDITHLRPLDDKDYREQCA